MKNKPFIILSLIITSIFFKANAQKKEYYPQVPFDSIGAKNMLTYGNSTIEGVAFTRTDEIAFNKVLAVNSLVTLFPVTPYFEEWYQLRKKRENKKTSVFMSQEAFKYRLTVNTDNYGRFKFERMKPGKYFLQSFANYSRSGITSTYNGSRYNNNGGITDYYTNQNYTNNYSNRIETFVEITRDGQTIEIKLK